MNTSINKLKGTDIIRVQYDIVIIGITTIPVTKVLIAIDCRSIFIMCKVILNAFTALDLILWMAGWVMRLSFWSFCKLLN
jgi:hypothetical protein